MDCFSIPLFAVAGHGRYISTILLIALRTRRRAVRLAGHSDRGLLPQDFTAHINPNANRTALAMRIAIIGCLMAHQAQGHR
jgi:hypothetical protein